MKEGCQKRAFEEFTDISEVLQPSPSAKMAWQSNFTIAVFSLHSAAPLPQASVFTPLVYFLIAVMRWLCSANPNMKQWRPLVPLQRWER